MSTVSTEKLNLVKGAAPTNLEEEAGKILKVLKVGLGWDQNTNNRIDLDASVIVYNESKEKIDQCFFNQKSALGGAITHSGDNVTGEGDGDDEVITIDASKLPPEAKHMVVTITNYTEQPLRLIKGAFARMIDGETNNELCRYELKQFGSETAMLMVDLITGPNGLEVKAIGQGAQGKTLADLVDLAKNHI